MMALDLFSAAALRVNLADPYEVVDAASGTVLARLVEAARVRSPRGNPLAPDPVAMPRLTFALTGPDGRVLLYVDRAEHLKFNFVPPQSAFAGPDGAVLGRVEYDHHSAAGPGGQARTDAQGMTVAPAARVLGPDLRPLCDVVYVTPPDGSRPTLPDGQDARTARWVTSEGAQVAERRDGVLRLDERLPGPWRALAIGSFVALACEFRLPAGDAPAPESIPEPFPGHAGLHDAYAAYQREQAAEYQQPVRTRAGLAHRPGVLAERRDHLIKIGLPIVLVLAAVIFLIRTLL
ncbi:hypothetical protein [Actinomadura terrae]|uniref:hypothetical protein n=1 Tax=Actinomadura terrae TaxID=604353 RepID=UPI001FA6E1F9|nr:hypothetical protein [Actinomadura terrae]